jgi:hypothetical protein
MTMTRMAFTEYFLWGSRLWVQGVNSPCQFLEQKTPMVSSWDMPVDL